MDTFELDEITVVGLALNSTTTNENGRSGIDCGNLWQKFSLEKYADLIPNKLNEDILAIYHSYEGNHNTSFSYFIGCTVSAGTAAPDGMDQLIVPKGKYQKFIAAGEIPTCITGTWNKIWNSNIGRAYKADFEVYDERTKDWKNAVVDIFISVV